ncbi:MAG: AsnC family transcriptional regulator [Bacteroidetes bacterium QS_8_68_15]|nr:MAG: AsnC family transcriptional regulator [Bacteroidetes bacterium QS_8_68_15]
MTTAIGLIDTERDRVNDVAEALVSLDGVSEVHSVAGRYDLVAILRVAESDDLAALVTEHVRHIDGITHSETLIGFRVHSSHDLERLFSVGMED